MQARVRASIHPIPDARIAETRNNYDAAGELRQLRAISGVKQGAVTGLTASWPGPAPAVAA
jgi:hypothetical protein